MTWAGGWSWLRVAITITVLGLVKYYTRLEKYPGPARLTLTSHRNVQHIE